ncbi:hypothetical protein EPUL_002835 [Erysiphe pulchra]|uniref:Uncharacterized protein n=1 Tax=Erysiphe pulchra TaxID=225359 RepID=A0A2S4PSA1_9PEZI|nr:hypothetical protein EPUL_002835 [Erysiphe pulchra]
MIVERLEEPSCPATLTVHLRSRIVSPTPQPDNDSTTPETRETIKNDDATILKEAKKEIKMKGRTHTKILENFLEVAKAKPVLCSEKDLQEIQWLERASENSLKEANIMKIHNEKRKRQEEMLSAAKGVTS